MRSQRRLFSPVIAVNLEPNTFIGGIASEIPTKAALAVLLGISESNIPFFQIVGNDVEARVNEDYNTPSNFLYTNANLIHWRDLDSHWKSTGAITFTNCYNLKEVIANGLTTISIQFCRNTPILKNVELNSLTILASYCFENASIDFLNLPSVTKVSQIGIGKKINKIFAPNCKFFGDDLTNNNVFIYAQNGLKIYVHKDLDPSDADITDAQSKGVTVIRILNTTAPNPITSLSIGTKYATALQLNFTPPSSVNAIDFYECYANGIYKNNITESGGYIRGLNPNTPYNITIIAVDIYLNESEFSNSVSDTTNATEPYPISNISNYYRFNNNLIDEVSANNGTGAAITYAAGKSGNAASFNGTTSNISFSQMLQAITAQSISCFVKSNQNSRQQRIFALCNGVGTPFLMLRIGTSLNRIECNVYDGGQVFIGTNDYDITQWNHIVITMVENNNFKLYVNGNLVATDNALGSYVVIAGGNRFGSDRNGGTGFSLNGQIDGVATWNKELSQSEISEIYSKQNSGLELI